MRTSTAPCHCLVSHGCFGGVETPRAFAEPSTYCQKAEQKCALVQQGKGAAPSATQAVPHILHKSARLEEVQKKVTRTN